MRSCPLIPPREADARRSELVVRRVPHSRNAPLARRAPRIRGRVQRASSGGGVKPRKRAAARRHTSAGRPSEAPGAPACLRLLRRRARERARRRARGAPSDGRAMDQESLHQVRASARATRCRAGGSVMARKNANALRGRRWRAARKAKRGPARRPATSKATTTSRGTSHPREESHAARARPRRSASPASRKRLRLAPCCGEGRALACSTAATRSVWAVSAPASCRRH
jgi:hypothetical protein